MVGKKNIHSADFSPDDKLVTTVSYEGHARVWDPVTGKELSQIGGAHEGADATFSPDGKLILVAGDRKSAFLSRATGKGVGTPFSINTEVTSGDGGRADASVISAEFSRDGKRILTVSDDATALTLGGQAHDPDKMEDIVRSVFVESTVPVNG